MNSITDNAATVATETPPRRYRSRLAPVTEPWQRPTDNVSYEPRHAATGNAQ